MHVNVVFVFRLEDLETPAPEKSKALESLEPPPALFGAIEYPPLHIFVSRNKSILQIAENRFSHLTLILSMKIANPVSTLSAAFIYKSQVALYVLVECWMKTVYYYVNGQTLYYLHTCDTLLLSVDTSITANKHCTTTFALL